jgi:hypothetical protein
MAINQRAFASAPVYEIRGDKHIIILDMFHWNGHPRFGSSTHEFPFDDEKTALDYMKEVTGYVIQR